MSTLPFSRVVGQDEAKLALILAAVEPRLGGVLLRGDKGSAKTTLARGLAALLAPGAPFVELPLGASEDRVVGSVDVAALLTSRRHAFRPGLLAAAHGGVVYVDEVNLLADHLVDTLLDVAVSGVNRVERDGVSESHPARFVLVGSMNPEEGELRPQLLDRFGLAVEVRATTDPAERAEIVTRQLAAERHAGDPGGGDDPALAARLAATRSATVGPEVVGAASRLALAVGAEGLRADLSLCRAASALAGWEGRGATDVDDLRRVAAMVLGHRRRRDPFEAPGMADEELAGALDEALADDSRGDDGRGDDGRGDDGRGDDGRGDDGPGDNAGRAGDGPPDASSDPGGPDVPDLPDPMSLALPVLDRHRRPARSAGQGRSGPADASPRGRTLRHEAYERPDQRLSVTATAVAAAVTGGPGVTPGDLRASVTEAPTARLVVVVVDASGSMAGRRRLDVARSAVLGLLGDAYRKRDRVAMVSMSGAGAEVVLRPTASVEVARTRLAEVPTGGTTPLAAGLRAAADLVRGSRHDPASSVVVVLTDGRATAGGDDPVAAAHAAAADLVSTGARCMVLDAESGPVRLGLARDLATAMRADHVELDGLGGDVEGAIRRRLEG